jgi:predicted negative regulator of RcsB-dependent stress response
MASTKTHHRKIVRKQLKQPDEFQSFFGNFRDFVLENLNQVIFSAVIVLVAATVALGTYFYERHRDNLASDQFYSAITALDQKDYAQAQQRFAELAEQEPGREVGRLARFYLGSAYLEQNDLKRARDAFATYLAGNHEPLFANFALANLAVIYERLGDYGKAGNAYSQAAATPGPEQISAELGAARMLLKQGKKAEAIKAYRAFLTAHPFSSERQDALESLALLGAAPQAGEQSQPTATIAPRIANPGPSPAAAPAKP